MTIDNSDVEHNLVGGIVRRPPPRFYTSQNSGSHLHNSPAFQIPRIRLIETLNFSRQRPVGCPDNLAYWQ